MNKLWQLLILLAVLAIDLLAQKGGAGAQTATPTASPVPTASTATPSPTVSPPPSALALFRQSAAAIKPSGWVHGSGLISSFSSTEQLTATLVGSCGNIRATFRNHTLSVTRVQGQVRLDGTSRVSGKTSHARARVILIEAHNHGTEWIHSSALSSGWHSRKVTGNQGLIDSFLIYVCLPELIAQAPPSVWKMATTGAKVKAATFDGIPSWEISSTQRQNGQIITSRTFIDRTSLYWLRFGERQRAISGSDHSRFAMDYSRYGARVAIKPPHG